MAQLLRSRWRLLAPVLVFAVAGIAVVVSTRPGVAQGTVIPAQTAVQRAVAYAHSGIPAGGRLIGNPTAIRGQVMTYAQAHQLRYGRPIDPTEGIWKERDRQVWTVELRGNIVLPDTTHTYHQMIITLDAQTAQMLGVSAYPTGREVATASLPAIGIPVGPAPTPVASPEIEPMATPAPTRPAGGYPATSG